LLLPLPSGPISRIDFIESEEAQRIVDVVNSKIRARLLFMI